MILAGVESAMIKSYRPDTLELFGAGDEHNAKFWTGVIRQGVLMGFLNKEIESYGLVSATGKGREFLANPTTLMLILTTRPRPTPCGRPARSLAKIPTQTLSCALSASNISATKAPKGHLNATGRQWNTGRYCLNNLCQKI